MKPISLKVRAVKGDKVTMSQFYNGTFSLTFSRRSPSVGKQKFVIGDTFELCLVKKNPISPKKDRTNRSRKKN